jgi:cyclase
MNINRRVGASALRVTLALAAILFLGTGHSASSRQNQSSDHNQEDKQHAQQIGKGKVELLHVQKNVYMIAGAGANITVQVGDQFVIVVDSGLSQMSDQVLGAIRSLTDKHIFLIIDTSADEDHIGGNENLSKAGWALPTSAQSPVQKRVQNDLELPPGASVIAHLNVLDRMSAPTGQKAPFPPALWPTDTYEGRYWRFYNGEGVFLYHPANAHTDGDSYVLFRGSDVVSTGDILNLASYPMIKADRGGSINGLIATLNQIIEILQPRENEEGGTLVIPGHGHISDRHDVVNYRDMVTIIRDRIQHDIKKGMTLDQVKVSKPTLDYDGLYGATSGPWTTDMFIEAVYRELSQSKS